MSLEKYGWEIRKSLLAQTNQDSLFSHIRKNSKMFNITLKYFSLFNNKPPASSLAHIAKNFFACYSCSYYSYMFYVGSFPCKYLMKQAVFLFQCLLITQNLSLILLKCSLAFLPNILEVKYQKLFDHSLQFSLKVCLNKCSVKVCLSIEFSTKFKAGQPNFLRSKCTSFLLHRKPVQQSCLHFFQKI